MGYAQNRTVAYKGAKPWHDDCVQVNAGMVGVEMLEAAKLRYAVRKYGLAVNDGQGSMGDVEFGLTMRTMRDGKGNVIGREFIKPDGTLAMRMLSSPLAEYRAICRPMGEGLHCYGVRSNGYQITQNETIVDFFRDYCEAGHAEIETVGGIDHGRIVWCLAKLQMSQTMINGVDEHAAYMLLATSHDGSLKLTGTPTLVRVVCENTLDAAIAGAKGKATTFRMKHSAKFDESRKAEARRIMGMAVEANEQSMDFITRIQSVEIDQKGRIEYINRLMGGESMVGQIIADVPSESDSLLDIVMAKTTAQIQTKPEDALNRAGKRLLDLWIDSPGSEWTRNTLNGGLQAVTRYVDHEMGRTQDTRLASAWFGAGATLKAKAVQVARDMAAMGVN